MYKLFFSPQAKKDSKKVTQSGLKEKVKELLRKIENNPFCYPPEYKFLKGELKGFVSRRINKQHRLIYEVLEDKKIIKIYSMWTHYE